MVNVLNAQCSNVFKVFLYSCLEVIPSIPISHLRIEKEFKSECLMTRIEAQIRQKGQRCQSALRVLRGTSEALLAPGGSRNCGGGACSLQGMEEDSIPEEEETEESRCGSLAA